MIAQEPRSADGRPLQAKDGPLARYGLPFLACVLVCAAYLLIACTTESETSGRSPAAAYYNRLADGFAHGQLALAQDVPKAFTELRDPYDPKANAPFRGQMYSSGRMHDLSYFRGRLYMYFSAVPAVILFLPFHLLTGAYLSHQLACALFSMTGFLAAAALFEAVRRRFFPAAGPWTSLACILAIGLVPFIPVVLYRPDVWEVPICCSFAFTMLALASLWQFLGGRRPWAWALAAGASAGLAVGSRPSSLLILGILVVPLVRAWARRRDRPGEALSVAAAALVPPAAVLGATMWYNFARFGSAAEFGQRYQLAGVRTPTLRLFSADYLLFNLNTYLLRAPQWTRDFPFVGPPRLAKVPVGHVGTDVVTGLVPSIPFALVALVVALLFLRPRWRDAARLKTIAAAAAWTCAAVLGVLGFFCGATGRYEMEFAPALVLLAAIGVLVLEDATRGRRAARLLARSAWLALLAASVAFNALSAVAQRSRSEQAQGNAAFNAGRDASAEAHYRRAIWMNPSSGAGYAGLGLLYAQTNRFEAGAAMLAKALDRAPPNASALDYYCAFCLYKSGRLSEAEARLQAALAISPDFPLARSALEEIRAAMARGPGAVHR